MAGQKKTAAKKKASAKKAPAKKTARKKAASKKVAKKAPAKKAVKKKAKSKDKLTFETTFAALAKKLGVSRKTLYEWKKIEGCPKPRSDGRHCVDEWRKFMAEKDLSGNSNDVTALRAEDLQVKIEERRFNLSVKRGEYVKFDEVREVWGICVAQVIQLLEKSLLDEQPPILAGMDDPIEIRQNNERVLNEARRILHSGEGLTP